MGPAGVGKSRLVHEFLSQVDDRATVIRGRCLPYGEAITFWADRRRPARRGGHRPARRAGRGLREDRRPPPSPDGDEAALVDRHSWAYWGSRPPHRGSRRPFGPRRLFEELAEKRPLVVVFEDIHWGEATFLDLLEYLAGFIRDAPIFAVCIARPELREARPARPPGGRRASSRSRR